MKLDVHSWSLVVLGALMVGLWPAVSAGAAMIEQTVAQLAGGSTDIVGGQVLSVISEWNETETFIFTRVNIRVDETHKGALPVPATITVIVPGGEVGEIGLGVEHAPQFEVGQEVIVFLRLLQPPLYAVTAWEQGKFTVENGEVMEKRASVSSFIEEIREALK